MTQLKDKVLQGAIWSLIQSWGVQASSLIIFFILARLLGPEAFGLVALANVFLAFMQIFLNQGFAWALIQREELEPEHLDAAFWTTISIGVGLAVLTFIGSPVVAEFFREEQLTPVLRCIALLLVIDPLVSVQQALLEREFAFKWIAIRYLFSISCGGGVGIALAFWGFGVWALVAQQCVQEIVGTAILWKASSWRPRWKFSWKHWRELLDFGINILVFKGLSFLNGRADDALISYFLGLKALGFYSLAYRILTAMTNLLVNSTSQVALPTFSRLQQDLERCRDVFYRGTQLSSAFAFPLFVGTATQAPELIVLLFGEDWLTSVPVLQVLCLVGAIRSVTYLHGSIFMAMGKPIWRLRMSALSASLNIIGFLIAVRWGIVAVAVAYLIRACLLFPIRLWTINRLIRISLVPYLHYIFPAGVSTFGMAIIIMSCKKWLISGFDPFTVLMISIGIGALSYFLSLYIFGPTLLREILGLAFRLITKCRETTSS